MSPAALKGRLAVVTGASGRLGPVWRSALTAAGARVVGLDLAEGEGVVAADVTDRVAVEAARERIAGEHGVPDVVVNNAGIDQPPSAGAQTARFEDVPLDDVRRTMDVNFVGAFNVCQVFGPAMVARGSGAVVNVGSLYAGRAAEPGFYDHMPADPPFLKPATYGASKAALLNLTRYLARLWGPHGVRVNALSPGGVLGGQDPEFLAKYISRTSMKRMAEPDDLAGPLVFLASDAARYVTGQELLVDGGFTA
ncbi:MAG: SDR family oxidoreductase [Solirubrobacteraceae bacterium]